MFLVSSIFLLYVVYGLLVFFEDYILKNQKKIIYWVTCILLIVMAGTREVGIDPDSENYENTFFNPYNDNVLDSVEFTYIIISKAFNSITNDVHSLFLVYALLGVLLKFVAFRRYSDSWLLMVFMYISFYYELHETCQIRAGVLSGCMLLAVPCIAEGKRWMALLWIAVGTCFHLSGLILLPLLFFGNKPLGRYWKIALALAIPFSYVFSGLNLGLEFASRIPYIGSKLAVYTEMEENGGAQVSALNIFGPLHLLMAMIFYYLLFFADTITEKSRYFPLMLKILATALVSYAVFSFIPVMGDRMGSMYRLIIVVLLPTIVYTLRPKWCGVVLLFLISFILINFSLRDMYGVTFILPPVK